MTTTLRPAGSEERADGGGLARTFDIRVNGRRAGVLRLSAEAAGGTGRIEQLEIDAADRRRGRATVALLAAEEVLRDWGCREAGAAVPAAAGGALALAATLGYTERNRNMTKRPAGPAPALPEGSAFRTMGDTEYPAWYDTEKAGFIRSWTERGMARERAAARAEAAFTALLPDGPATKDQALRVLTHDGTDVGALWLSLAAGRLRHGTDAWVFGVRVDEPHRGCGHGRSLMLEAERLCLAVRARLLGLNVFAGNSPALGLYTSLGYRTVEFHLYKSLG